jgi:hypothetical protein
MPNDSIFHSQTNLNNVMCQDSRFSKLKKPDKWSELSGPLLMYIRYPTEPWVIVPTQSYTSSSSLSRPKTFKSYHRLYVPKS